MLPFNYQKCFLNCGYKNRVPRWWLFRWFEQNKVDLVDSHVSNNKSEAIWYEMEYEYSFTVTSVRRSARTTATQKTWACRRRLRPGAGAGWRGPRSSAAPTPTLSRTGCWAWTSPSRWAGPWPGPGRSTPTLSSTARLVSGWFNVFSLTGEFCELTHKMLIHS